MKLWLISQDKNDDYDTYDSAVVAAATEEEARHMTPRGRDIGENESAWSCDWVKDPNDVTVKLVGTATEGTKKGVICASYNAG